MEFVVSLIVHEIMFSQKCSREEKLEKITKHVNVYIAVHTHRHRKDVTR